MSRGGKVAWGLGLIIAVLILWLFLRGRQPLGESGDVTLGDIFFGGYSEPDIIVEAKPSVFNFLINWVAPSPGVLPGGPSDAPCLCGCQSLSVDFLDLTDFARALEVSLQADEIERQQKYFAANPLLYTFANANRIAFFAD